MEPLGQFRRPSIVNGIVIGFLAALCVGCSSTSTHGVGSAPSAPASSNASSPTSVATPPTQPTTVANTGNTSGSTISSERPTCPVPPGDQPPQQGDCTLVDWDVIAVDGANLTVQYYVNDPGCSLGLDRVETTETTSGVTLRVIVGYSGDEGATCPTAYSSRTSVVTLRQPLGSRTLAGCRPIGSFVPKGGYNNPDPRSNSASCLSR